MVKFASPSSCVRFISFGFLLATTCVWVCMVCSLHSVTTGSRDRANVPLIIIIIIIIYSTDFLSRVACFWSCSCSQKKMKFLTSLGTFITLIVHFQVFPWHFYFMRGHSLVELTEHDDRAADIILHGI